MEREGEEVVATMLDLLTDKPKEETEEEELARLWPAEARQT